jgi:hypothetical protein
MNFVQAKAILFFVFILSPLYGQDKPAPEKTAPVALDANDPAAKNEDKRVLGVLPNYRTAELTPDYHPISNKYKLKIALKDTFDYPLIGVGAAYAGLYQLENSHPQFGQGMVGYARRFGTSYTDQVVGNMMTEGILPILFKEDPRYFRKAEGSVRSRMAYAFSRIVITKTNTGAKSFNFAEIIGNGVAAGVGLSYYSDDRDFADFAQNWGTQLATDAISQVLKEFWPDIKRRYFHRRSAAGSIPAN